jgi:GTPase involved in cell partitioning and DNA repair
MLESFLQAQKVSVRKTLQRSFRRYVTYGEENNQLIMHQLQNLITEVEKYKMVSHINKLIFMNKVDLFSYNYFKF